MTEDKLLLFLKKEVVNRVSKKQRRKHKEGEPLETIGHKSILNYVSAITKLWERQRDLKVGWKRKTMEI